MRYIKRLVTALVVLLAVSPLFAQETAAPEGMFVKSVPITRVYTYRGGYRILYTKSSMETGEFLVPMEWFREAGGRGEVVTAEEPTYPYFSVFWRDGEFDHIRLYLHANPGHITWGSDPTPAEFEGDFDSIETPDIEY